MFDHFKIAHRIAVVRVACIHQMRNQTGAFNVFQKTRAQPRAFVRSFDQSGHVGNNESSALSWRSVWICRNDAKMRLQCRKRIRRNFRTSSGNPRN